MKYNFLNLIYNLFKKIKDVLIFIYPPQCIICDHYIKEYNQICDNCLMHIEFINENICCNCGNILNISNSKPEYGNTCILCALNPPYFSKFVSSLFYNDMITKIISKFKYGDYQELSKELMSILVYTYAEADYNDVDIIIPMPISYRKLLKRKYNQTLLLARYLSKYTNIPIKYNILVKSKHTKAQASLSLEQRKHNIKNSFSVNKKLNKYINNKIILLIDDVVTTGNTINEASKTLRLFGAKRVYVLSLARVKGSFKIY